jgi:YVTN family beta-propeller protein
VRISRWSLLGLLLVAAPGCSAEDRAGSPPFQRDPPPVGALGGRILVANGGEDTVSVLDPVRLDGRQTIPVGLSPIDLEGPHHLSVDREGKFIYLTLTRAVPGSGSGPHGDHSTGDLPGYVLKIDAATGRTAALAQVDRIPADGVLSGDGKWLYITHYDVPGWRGGAYSGALRQGDSDLAIIDTESMVVQRKLAVCPAGHGVQLSQDGATVYLTCGPDEIAAVDVAGAPVVRRFSLTGEPEGEGCRLCPYGLAVAPDGLIWVSCLGENSGAAGQGSLSIFDPQAGAFDPGRRISFTGSPMVPVVVAGADGYQVVVAERGRDEGAVRVFGPPPAGQPPPQLELLVLRPSDCPGPSRVLVPPGEQHAFLVCQDDGTRPGRLAWLRREPLAMGGWAALGISPDGLTLVPR